MLPSDIHRNDSVCCLLINPRNKIMERTVAKLFFKQQFRGFRGLSLDQLSLPCETVSN